MKYDMDITEYGACPDGKTMSTQAIQAAIDACHHAGGGRVVCGPGTFVTGALTLKSNVEMHLSGGCRIIASTCPGDYRRFTAPGLIGPGDKATEKDWQALIGAVDAENIAITGPGEINGSGLSFYDHGDKDASGKFNKPPTPRPRIVMFYRCRRVRFEDASFIDSPCWTFWLMKCREVNVHRVKMRGDWRMRNIDGIDIDSCNNVTVSDCFFDTEDDCIAVRAIRNLYDTPAVCENITVANCVFESRCNGVRVGCPGDGSIRNCVFDNLVIRNSSGNGILFEFPKRYLPKDGLTTADVHDIMFSNVVVNCAGAPIKVIVQDSIRLKRLSDLSFSGFRIKSGLPCMVKGSPETIIRKVSFRNMDIETSGEDAIICRNCEGVRFTDVAFANILE